MSRLLLKIILLVFGIGAVFYGIRGICICFTGGTIVLPESSGDKTGGFFGVLWCFYYIGIGMWALIGIRGKKKKKRKRRKNPGWTLRTADGGRMIWDITMSIIHLPDMCRDRGMESVRNVERK